MLTQNLDQFSGVRAATIICPIKKKWLMVFRECHGNFDGFKTAGIFHVNIVPYTLFASRQQGYFPAAKPDSSGWSSSSSLRSRVSRIKASATMATTQ
jgi:hypothetical protein